MNISFNIEPIIFILAGISFAFATFFIIWEYINLRSLKKCIQKSEANNNNNTEGVSVIIYADNDTENLGKNLSLFLEQDYPNYEVIVVNDGANEATKDLLESWECRYDNLRLTYTPDDAKNLSRKKLAIMIGIKAAQNDIIITTNGNCVPASNQWISSIAKHFSNGADVVLGHVKYDLKSAFNNFLFHQDAVKHLTYALRHKPYRGTSENLAYRKSLFFKNKGFSRSMHLHYGEDDLFVNEIATKRNTSVEIAPNSIISVDMPHPDYSFTSAKLRRAFTERMIHSFAFPLSTIKSLLPLLSIAAIITSIAFAYTNLIVIGFAILLFLLATTLHLLIIRKTSLLLQTKCSLALIPIFAIAQPFTELYYNLKSRRHTTYNYTWQPLK